jgi:hypothetical protein
LAKDFNVEPAHFLRVYKNFENITGPTHLYSLVKPKLEGLSTEEQIKEIRVKRVFKIYFIWFLRHRYIRYIIREGKMEKKDAYINYKNKELLHLITQEGVAS